jgi:hypothetical protein
MIEDTLEMDPNETGADFDPNETEFNPNESSFNPNESAFNPNLTQKVEVTVEIDEEDEGDDDDSSSSEGQEFEIPVSDSENLPMKRIVEHPDLIQVRSVEKIQAIEKQNIVIETFDDVEENIPVEKTPQ